MIQFSATFILPYSRETLKHSEEKEALLNKMFAALRPGGKLIMTDYCLGDKVRVQILKKEHYIRFQVYYIFTISNVMNISYTIVKRTTMGKLVRSLRITLTIGIISLLHSKNRNNFFSTVDFAIFKLLIKPRNMQSC